MIDKVLRRTYATAKYGSKFSSSKFSQKRISPTPSFKKFRKTNNTKPEKKREYEFGDSLRHNFGEFNGLTSVDKVVSFDPKTTKNKTLIDYKILEPVREFFNREILKKSLLYQYKRSNKMKIDEIPLLTNIQSLSFSQILKNRSRQNPYELRIFSIAGETGCGKTYAYLVPLINNLKKDQTELQKSLEGKIIASEFVENFTNINSVILLPTNELISQTYETVKNASELGLTVKKWDHKDKIEDLIELKQPIDILITTPAKFSSMQKYLKNSFDYRKLLGSIRYCVIDEADFLFDRSFLAETMKSFEIMSGLSKILKDLIIVSSTVSKVFNKNLTQVFKDNLIIRIGSQRLHKITKKLDLKVIDCNMRPFNNNKINALKQCLYSIHCDNTESYASVKKVLVFVNEKESVGNIFNILETDQAFKNYEIYKITGENSIEERLITINNFNNSEPLNKKPLSEIKKNEEEEEKEKEILIPGSNIKFSSKNSEIPQQTCLKVLVTSDILSRGMNFQQTANTILFDVPKTTSDLVNRVGRVGRIGVPGRAFLLAGKGENKSWVRGLPKAIEKGIPLA